VFADRFFRIVLDLNPLQWLNKAQVNYPPVFDQAMKANGTFKKDLKMPLLCTNQRQIAHCLQDIPTVWYIDTNSIGCVTSSVALYLFLIFMIGVVAIRFVMTVMFAWFFSWKLGTFPKETHERQRSAEIESWGRYIPRYRT
jgi:chitin synthase